MISVLVPYRPDGGQHDRNWEWVRQRWEATCPDFELIVEGDDGGSSPAEFNHPLALNRAAERATGRLLLLADIDIVPDRDWVARAVGMVAGGAPWVVAEEYRKVSEMASLAVLGSDPAAPAHPAWGWRLEEPPVLSSCASPIVIPREGFEAAGGYDERISWWGADDAIFRVCVDTFWGRMERCPGAALHLWHPTVPFAHPNQEAQQVLLHRYLKAAGDPDAVRAVRYP